jgi:hypothetical protein
LAALYLADDSQIGYFEYIYSYGIGQDTRPPTVRADFMLGPLASFCEAAASFLTPEERAQMLAFVIPDYAQSDYAVRIYVALNP